MVTQTRSPELAAVGRPSARNVAQIFASSVWLASLQVVNFRNLDAVCLDCSFYLDGLFKHSIQLILS